MKLNFGSVNNSMAKVLAFSDATYNHSLFVTKNVFFLIFPDRLMTISYFPNLWEVSYFWLWVVALHNFHAVSENYVLQFNPQTMKAIKKMNCYVLKN